MVKDLAFCLHLTESDLILITATIAAAGTMTLPELLDAVRQHWAEALLLVAGGILLVAWLCFTDSEWR